MKPDWQNKSFAKTSSPSGPSTTHPKLKVGMSSLHSKIAVANHNTVQAKKPAVRKMADGGTVRTRSDEEIGDTNVKSGVVDPGSFERRAAQGEKNLQALKDAFNKFTGEKSAPVSTDMAENKQPVERFAATKSPEPEPKPKAEEKPRQITDYMAKAPESDVVDYGNEGGRTSMARSAAPIKPVKKAAQSAAKPVAETKSMPTVEEKPVQKSAPAERPETKPPQYTKLTYKEDILNQAPTINRSGSTIGQSQKDIEQLIRQRQGADSKTDTGDETKRLRDRTSTFVPGFGQIDKQGNIIPNVRGGRMASQVYGAKEDSFLTSAEKRYLQSRIDAGNLTAMEKAQAKRAGLI